MSDGRVGDKGGGRRVAVVTGGNRGIGRWVALGLAAADHHVALVVRDRGRGEEAARWIRAHCPGASVAVTVADLSTAGAVRAVGAELAARHPAVAVLVNNAGLFTPHRTETADGHETTLAVNHLAPFVLTRALEAALRAAGREAGKAAGQAAGGARVINVGSTASDRTGIDVYDLESRKRWSIWGAYARSKLALMMASFEWAERFEGAGVTVNVVHPGLVATDIGAVPGPVGWGWKVVSAFGLTERQGADTPLFLAVSPRVAGRTGLYWKKRAPARPNRRALDPALRAQLWAETERLIDG